MDISTETAQLILDAIAWANHFWYEELEMDLKPQEEINLARNDFVEFCAERGIEGVTKP